MEDLLLAFRLIAQSKKKQPITIDCHAGREYAITIRANLCQAARGFINFRSAEGLPRSLRQNEQRGSGFRLAYHFTSTGGSWRQWGRSSHSEHGFPSLPLNADETREVTPPLPTIRLGRRGHVPGTSHAHILPSSLSAQSQEFHRIVRSVGTI
ncbi:hypothetical protein K443DRAFT_671554 [Laccaria amethystina LaAM-08-1]|jgi:hypothetical protein|uniref:Uncharacterized protein n=1 Tax=Laccaria amethystina LaAM-08-1 TaxID=1095629 RepID=A0A0C9YNS0_9AGAR|nr:hypothetical protein K443DRAFT_671554 [Laccaria amethystina LaAM-08-1]